eukprot:gnl/Chilomastix_cuspidata/242.p1 GENE.gnl/Chilomastix_cuspidata/242~~gnl/Chilomastix_cuspidata/242.p1  ORF type:complete len:1259 (+),score=463.77 gnl/Chilomastix_cuspidata/242:421-4197(+)
MSIFLCTSKTHIFKISQQKNTLKILAIRQGCELQSSTSRQTNELESAKLVLRLSHDLVSVSMIENAPHAPHQATIALFFSSGELQLVFQAQDGKLAPGRAISLLAPEDRDPQADLPFLGPFEVQELPASRADRAAAGTSIGVWRCDTARSSLFFYEIGARHTVDRCVEVPLPHTPTVVAPVPVLPTAAGPARAYVGTSDGFVFPVSADGDIPPEEELEAVHKGDVIALTLVPARISTAVNLLSLGTDMSVYGLRFGGIYPQLVAENVPHSSTGWPNVPVRIRVCKSILAIGPRFGEPRGRYGSLCVSKQELRAPTASELRSSTSATDPSERTSDMADELRYSPNWQTLSRAVCFEESDCRLWFVNLCECIVGCDGPQPTEYFQTDIFPDLATFVQPGARWPDSAGGEVSFPAPKALIASPTASIPSVFGKISTSSSTFVPCQLLPFPFLFPEVEASALSSCIVPAAWNPHRHLVEEPPAGAPRGQGIDIVTLLPGGEIASSAGVRLRAQRHNSMEKPICGFSSEDYVVGLWERLLAVFTPERVVFSCATHADTLVARNPHPPDEPFVLARSSPMSFILVSLRELLRNLVPAQGTLEDTIVPSTRMQTSFPAHMPQELSLPLKKKIKKLRAVRSLAPPGARIVGAGMCPSTLLFWLLLGTERGATIIALTIPPRKDMPGLRLKAKFGCDLTAISVPFMVPSADAGGSFEQSSLRHSLDVSHSGRKTKRIPHFPLFVSATGDIYVGTVAMRQGKPFFEPQRIEIGTQALAVAPGPYATILMSDGLILPQNRVLSETSVTGMSVMFHRTAGMSTGLVSVGARADWYKRTPVDLIPVARRTSVPLLLTQPSSQESPPMQVSHRGSLAFQKNFMKTAAVPESPVPAAASDVSQRPTPVEHESKTPVSSLDTFPKYAPQPHIPTAIHFLDKHQAPSPHFFRPEFFLDFEHTARGGAGFGLGYASGAANEPFLKKLLRLVNTLNLNERDLEHAPLYSQQISELIAQLQVENQRIRKTKKKIGVVVTKVEKLGIAAGKPPSGALLARDRHGNKSVLEQTLEIASSKAVSARVRELAATAHKNNLKRVLRHFEDEFLRVYGRKPCVKDKAPLASMYNDYKQLKGSRQNFVRVPHTPQGVPLARAKPPGLRATGPIFLQLKREIMRIFSSLRLQMERAQPLLVRALPRRGTSLAEFRAALQRHVTSFRAQYKTFRQLVSNAHRLNLTADNLGIPVHWKQEFTEFYQLLFARYRGARAAAPSRQAPSDK